MTSLKGQFLIASPKLHDPNFFRTVVLMVQHDENNALGLVINRALETSIKDAWEQVSESSCEIDAPIHQGGPCEGPLMLVHTNPAFADLEIMPGLFFTTERENVEELVSRNHGEIKFFVNYSGWGPGQLEGELEAGGWLTAPASPDQVFSEKEDVWIKLYQHVSTPAVYHTLNPKVIPPDPSMN
jgi:putative transcriptional regulator